MISRVPPAVWAACAEGLRWKGVTDGSGEASFKTAPGVRAIVFGHETLGGHRIVIDRLHPLERNEFAVELGGPLIRGRVTAVDGRPIRGWRFDFLSNDWPFVRHGAADEGGRFELRSTPGPHVIASAPIFGGSLTLHRVDLAPDTESLDVSIVLDHTGVIRGHVVDELGRPMAGWLVVASPELEFLPGGMRGWAGRVVSKYDVSDESKEDGSFVLERLPKDIEFDVYASQAFDDSEHIHHVLPGAESLTLQTPIGGVIRGRVRFEGGPRPSRFFVVVGKRSQSCDPTAGIFHVLAPRAGDVDIEVRAEGYRTERRRVFVKPTWRDLDIEEEIVLRPAQ
jgi:hypothetical protein